MFDVFSIVFLVILIVFCIIGYIKGFLALLLGLAKGLVAIILASLLCKPVGGIVNKTAIGTGIVHKIETSLIEKDSTFSYELSEDNKDIFIDEVLDQKLGDAKIPKVIRNNVKNLLVEKVKVDGTVTVGAYIGQGISLYVCIIISYVVLFILLFILLTIMQKLMKQINKIPLVGLVNRLLGLGLGGLFALTTIAIICYIITFLMMIPGGMSDWLSTTLKLTEVQSSEFSVAKFMYEHNILKWIFNIIFS